MKRKNYWFLFAILLLSLTSLSPSFEFTRNIANQSPDKDPKPPSRTPDIPESDKGPIQIAVDLDGLELDKLKQMNREFMKRTGASAEIIPLKSVGFNEEAFIQKMSLGEGPDVLLVDSQWIKSLAVKGYLLPIDASQALPDSQLFGGLLPPVQWNGYQWGIPFDIDPYVIAWHKGEEQLELPSGRKAWQEFKKIQDHRPVFSINPEDPYAFASVVYTLGGEPEQPDKEVLSMMVPPAGNSWLQYNDARTTLRESDEDTESLGASISIGAYSSLGKDLPEGYELSLIGYNTDKQKPIVKSRSYAVTSESQSSLLALSWITEMTSTDAEREWTETTGKLTALSNSISNSDSAVNQPVNSNKIEDQISVLLKRDEAVRMTFGRDDGFMAYAISAFDLLHGHITIEQFQEHYAVSSP